MILPRLGFEPGTFRSNNHVNLSLICLKMKEKQCRDQGSNQGPSDLQSDALPTELSRHI